MPALVSLRILALLCMLAALAISGYLFVERSGLRELGAGGGADSAEVTASLGVAAANLQSAAVALESARAASGTYAGAQLAIPGVRLVRGDAASYCVEATVGTTTMHLRGPRQGAAPGPCL